MDLISRQATMDEISKQQTYKMFYGEDTMYLDANDVASVLASMPSVERRKATWLPDNIHYYEVRFICSNCGISERVPRSGFNDKPIWRFCPYCGADMRGEQDG